MRGIRSENGYMNYKNIKLIVLDLDGTLLSDEGTIGEKSKKYTKLLKEKGVIISFASGRMFSALNRYAEELQIEAPLICSDGAVLKHFPSGELIERTYLKPAKVERGINLSEKFLVKMVLCTEKNVLYTEHNEASVQLIDRFGAEFQKVDNYHKYLDEIVEIVYVGENRESLREIKKNFSFPYSFGLKVNYSKSQSHRLYYLEVKKEKVSKAIALKKLLKKLRISIKDTVVVGDWYNDVELFKTKAVKVSLSNAVPEIKYLSDEKLEFSNNDDGVGELLEKIYNQKN